MKSRAGIRCEVIGHGIRNALSMSSLPLFHRGHTWLVESYTALGCQRDSAWQQRCSESAPAAGGVFPFRSAAAINCRVSASVNSSSFGMVAMSSHALGTLEQDDPIWLVGHTHLPYSETGHWPSQHFPDRSNKPCAKRHGGVLVSCSLASCSASGNDKRRPQGRSLKSGALDGTVPMRRWRSAYFRPELIVLKTWLTLPPSSVRIPMTTMAMSTRIKAYSTRPCPSSLAKKLRSMAFLFLGSMYE
jgi:hypothetical protein